MLGRQAREAPRALARGLDEAPFLIEVLALAIVALAAVYLLALGAASLAVPAQASRFLLRFATTRTAHFTELLLRIVVGAALVVAAPRLLFPDAFDLFGWVLIVTTTCLVLIPWQWHRRFAQHAVPRAVRYIGLVGVVSLAFGGFVLVAVLRGNAAWWWLR